MGEWLDQTGVICCKNKKKEEQNKGSIGLAQVSSVAKYKIMTSAKEKDTAEETCIVTSWECGHCGEAYCGGQNSAHLL